MKAAQECNTMSELRSVIDALDRQIVGLLVQRMGCIDRAVVLKPTEGMPARIETRVQAVVENVRNEAEVQGFDPDLAERMWREMIEWSIAREEQTLGRTKQ